jgi:polar amino acid transport system substrate-binding protein
VRLKPILVPIAVAVLALAAAGCGGSSKSSSSTEAASASCDKDELTLVQKGQLTIGTDNPAFPPWFGGTPPKGSMWKVSDPTSGQGFEGAVAYAVAKQLGFDKDAVKWVVVPFDQAFKPGSKSFDFDINQVSYTPQRAKSVDFSDSYYDVNQALVGVKGTPITSAKSIADLKKYKLGVQKIKPSQKPSVYNTSSDVNSGLKAKQIDGIVVDLPTAFFITGAGQVPNSVVVGQFPTEKTPEHFGLVLAKDSKLTPCVDKALASLKSSGTLAKLQREWLSNKVSAPVLK